MQPQWHVTAVVPARDEAGPIAGVVRGLQGVALGDDARLEEIIVCDNGSGDATAVLAQAAGARVVREPRAGYGAACATAIAALAPDCDVVLFVDGDGSCDPHEAARLIAALRGGADLAVGVRRRVLPGALTPLQRLGTRLVCLLIRGLWRRPVRDLGPYRAIRRSGLERLHMRDRGFGWTAEMQVRAIQAGLRTADVPVSAYPRAAGRSKISGNPLGVLRAGRGLLVTVLRLWLAQRRGHAPEARAVGHGAPSRPGWPP